MNKIYCYFKIMNSMIKFKLSKPNDSFWVWLYKKTTDINDSYFSDTCLIKFLVFDALERKDVDSVLSVYEEHKELLIKENLLDKIASEINAISESQHNL